MLQNILLGMFALAPAWCPDHHPPTSKASTSSWDVCLLPSLEATQPKRTMASSHRLGVPCSRTVPLSWSVSPELGVSAAIKPSLLWERHVYGVLQENLKASLPQSLWAIEKRKLPRVWVQLCFQMCQGSEVKDKSTRMWRTPTRNWFAVCAFLTGGGRWAQCLVFLLSTAPSEWPHFAAVSYDTTSFVLAPLAMLPVAQRQNVSRVKHSGWKKQGIFSPSCRASGHKLASGLLKRKIPISV